MTNAATIMILVNYAMLTIAMCSVWIGEDLNPDRDPALTPFEEIVNACNPTEKKEND